jgi:hypothetical protein
MWDARKLMGCLCESTWAVGLEANETQEAEWFGPDCSLREWHRRLRAFSVISF